MKQASSRSQGNDRPARVGIIGIGKVGTSHLSKYQEIPGAEVVAICDLNEPVVRQAAETHGVKNVYTDYHELLKRDDIDAVDVCLHNNFHRPVTIDALEAGKHVYCEKPIAATYADGKAMVDAAERTGRMLHVQMGTCFGLPMRAAKKAVDAGELGEVYHGRAFVNLRKVRPFVDGKNTAQFVQMATSGGGALIDWGIYTICQILYLMGNPSPKRITGYTCTKIPMDEQKRRESGWDVEELGAGFVHFDNGATMDILAAWALHANVKIPGIVAGSLGGVTLGPLPGGKDIPTGFFSAVTDPWTEKELETDSIAKELEAAGIPDAYDHPQNHWVRVLQGKVPLMPTKDLALNMILIANAIYRSHELDREVRADEIREGKI